MKLSIPLFSKHCLAIYGLAVAGACTGVDSRAAEADKDIKPAFQSPCASEVWWSDSGTRHSDFDFWVGEWMVFDRKSGRLNGIDLIEKDLGGCAIKQRWRHMNDDYSLAGAPWRMQGTSSSGIAADGLWHQQWVDNNGGLLQLKGKRNADGEMQLETDWMEFVDRKGTRHRTRHRWHWKPLPDGSIHNWGYQQRGLPEIGEWILYYDIEYRPIAVGDAQLQKLEKPKSEG